MVKTEEAFRKLWGKLYNPHSGCPDVSLGHVLDAMADILVEAGDGPPDLEDIERWVLAYTAVVGQSSLMDLTAGYTESKVPHYLDTGEKDENGYPKRREWEDIEADEEKARLAIIDAVGTLLKRGLLVEEEGRLRCP